MSTLNVIKNNKLKFSFSIMIILFVLIIAMASSFKIAPVSWHVYEDINVDNGIAVQGVDVVAYFNEQKYVAGKTEYSINIEGTTWYFSNIKNRNLFLQDPQKYSPQYGGYCAVAVKEGLTADADPKQWLVQNNKLYLFFDENVKKDWLADSTSQFSLTANKNWESRFTE